MIVVYRTSRASFAVGKRLVRVRWISLVNILAGEEVVPELLQGDVDAATLEKEGEELLESPERLLRMRFELERVARQLGPPGASDRAAQALLESIGAPSSAGRVTGGHGVERLA
jgi:lipid-A-disaccharide synthase